MNIYKLCFSLDFLPPSCFIAILIKLAHMESHLNFNLKGVLLHLQLCWVNVKCFSCSHPCTIDPPSDRKPQPGQGRWDCTVQWLLALIDWQKNKFIGTLYYAQMKASSSSACIVQRAFVCFVWPNLGYRHELSHGYDISCV